MVIINGESKDIAGQRLADYLAKNQYDKNKIAVERNGQIVAKSQYEVTTIMDEDRIEIVRFVGGG